MPYVPSKKTDGKSRDRERIDAKVKEVAKRLCIQISKSNIAIAKYYLREFIDIGNELIRLDKNRGQNIYNSDDTFNGLAEVIYNVASKYNYRGAFLGELNYAITRLIQEVPKELVNRGDQPKEIRYFIYAYTVDALTKAHYYFVRQPGVYGIAGVFEDIKDEYKRRVNTAYEALQIVKSGDCYDTPVHTQLVEVVDEEGNHKGYMEVMIKHEDWDGKDVSGKIVINKG